MIFPSSYYPNELESCLGITIHSNCDNGTFDIEQPVEALLELPPVLFCSSDHATRKPARNYLSSVSTTGEVRMG